MLSRAGFSLQLPRVWAQLWLWKIMVPVSYTPPVSFGTSPHNSVTFCLGKVTTCLSEALPGASSDCSSSPNGPEQGLSPQIHTPSSSGLHGSIAPRKMMHQQSTLTDSSRDAYFSFLQKWSKTNPQSWTWHCTITLPAPAPGWCLVLPARCLPCRPAACPLPALPAQSEVQDQAAPVWGLSVRLKRTERARGQGWESVCNERLETICWEEVVKGLFANLFKPTVCPKRSGNLR